MESGKAESMSKDMSVLRWGGVAGLVTGVMIVLSIVAGFWAPALFVSAIPGSSCGAACYVDAALPGFPGVKDAIIVENAFYFAAIASLVVFFACLYRTLGSGGKRAPALAGMGVVLLGLAMEAVGALPVIAFAHLSEVYQSSSPQDQTTLILVSESVQSIFNTTDATGGLLLAIGFVMFGLAMFQNTTGSGKGFGGVTIALSVVALVGISWVSIGMDNPNDPYFVVLLLVLPVILGFRLYTLSRAPRARTEAVPS